ncbi:alkaline shock response membrane anchor protein AmaP [Kitasatospora sp. NPDC051914]|uniref:alkaline shock response membrane anchor protein AmaP n=1 Tax=Kitasatospora sp. NPDC051914 TaxID=3154945 RepID=UPI003441CC02
MSRSAVNRTILLVVGIVLIGGGLLLLAGGFDLYDRLGIAVPDGWPLTSPDQPVLSEASRARWSGQDWWWPVAIAVPALVVIGGLAWLWAQLRRVGPGTVTVPVPGGDGVALRMRNSALQDAVEGEVVELPGVDKVTVRATGGPHRLSLRAVVRLLPGTHPGEALQSLDAGPLENARTSLGLAELPTEIRLRATARRPGAGPKPPRVV